MKDPRTLFYVLGGLGHVRDPWNFVMGRVYVAQDAYGSFACFDRLATICFRNGWETEVRAMVEAEPAGHLFVDVGANVGKYSVMASKRGLRVIALEPDPRAFFLLQYNLGRNACQNVSALAAAAWNEETTRPYYLSSHHDLGGMKERDVYGRSLLRGSPTRCVRLDEVLKNLEPNLIKIDVEGSEFEVLEGLEGTLQTKEPKIIFEALDRDALRRNHGLLSTYGYQVRQLNRTNFLGIPP